jgi:hypothetical protein
MNGCEHYEKAERLVQGGDLDVQVAQVHALLAIAAALLPTYRVENVSDLTADPDVVIAIQEQLKAAQTVDEDA